MPRARYAQRRPGRWLGCRDLERGESAVKELAADGDVWLVSLDVTDGESVRAAAARVGGETGALDVLVNNAGVAIGEGEGLPAPCGRRQSSARST